MIVWIFLFYFLVAVAVIWLVMFPDARERLVARIRQLTGAGVSKTSHWRQRTVRGAGMSAAVTRSQLNRGRGYLVRHRLSVLGVLLLLTFPPLVVMHMQGLLDFNSFDAGPRTSNELVDALLNGERLTPPKPLPPEVFTTKQVELLRPGLGGANRDWGMLKLEFRQRLLAVFKKMQNKYGYKMVMIEGYRSPARQNRLASGGVTVTRAKANQSYHQYGLAADAAFYRHGKLVISAQDAWTKRGYKLYGRVARSFGLTWGGGWRLKDYGHVELRGSRYHDPSK